MALILQMFLRSKNQQQNDTTKQQLYIETTRLHLKKEDPNNKEIPVKSNKKSKPP
jgi:hypothetical protein